MAVRYRNTFYSYAGVLWQVDILDSTYTGSVNLFTSDKDGFTLSYKGVTERLDPIMASTLTVPMLIVNSAQETFLSETMFSQENRFRVDVYKDSVLYWRGVLLADQVNKEDIAYPYIVDINFTDGLARLRDMDYNNGALVPLPYTGRDTIIDHLLKILSKTGITDLYSADDYYLHTIVNWYDAHHNYNYYSCPLEFTDLSHSIFYEYDDNGIITYEKTYDVLDMILRTFNARILMVNGRWYVIQPQELSRLKTFERAFDKSGLARWYNDQSDYRVTHVVTTRKTGGITKYYAPLKKVIRTYKTKIANTSTGSILPVQTIYTPAVNLMNDIPSAARIYIDGTIRQRFSLDDMEGDPIRIFTVWKCEFVLTPNGGGSPLYIDGPYAGAFLWTTTEAGSGAYVNSPQREGRSWDFKWPLKFVFTAPVFIEGYTATFKLTISSHKNSDGSAYTIGDNHFSAEYSDFTCVIEVDGEGYENTDDIIFTALNTSSDGSPVNSTIELKPPDTMIGDGPTTIHLGKLKTSDSGTWVDSTLWKVHNSTVTSKINQLSATENLKGQRIPVEKFTGGFIDNSISALTPVKWGDKVFVPYVLSINPVKDEITGEWFNCIIPSQ